MFTTIDQQMMQRALDLAERGRFTTQPNPRVGCVIAHGERIVGEGWHRKAGEAHAEPLALQAAGAGARGATAYVTLEPHCHHSRTPPCTRALIAAGIQRVVCATLDPNPQVHGAGVRQMQESGVQVEVGLLEAQARELNAGFEKRMTSGLPRVVVKIASSLDGRVALASGESKWITGPAARADVQRLRAATGAILTGVATVLSDDPQLTVRDPSIDTLGRQPLRAIVDTRLRMPANARMLREPGRTVVFTPVNGAALGSAQVVAVPSGTGGVDLHQVLRRLADMECNDVLVEAGPTLTGRIVEAGLVDELIVYIAPVLLGSDALPMLQMQPLARLADRLQFRIHHTESTGDDLKVVLRPRR